jgi:adenine specific DNA methylase Mod
MKMDGKSTDVRQEKIEKLKEIMPEIFTEGKIDQHQLNLTLGEVVVTEGERYVLNWAGKTDAFKVLQETTTATFVPAEKESVDFDKTQNIFIEGENLEVLKVLQKSYYGKIKMIYIDPPYNTGNDSFIYPDRFQESKDEYLKRIGDKDEEGLLTKEGLFRKNNKESGHFHSNWLSMMYPRLFLARNLLREDGVIFVSIDDNEVHNLRLLMNEIFGEENFCNSVVIKRGAKSVQRQFDTIDKLGCGYETVLMYKRNTEYRFPLLERNRDDGPKEGGWNNHWRGTDRPTMRYVLFGIVPKTGQWRWSEERSKKAIANYNRILKELNRKPDSVTQSEIDDWYIKEVEKTGEEPDLLRLSDKGKPEHYIPPSETVLANDVWFDFPPNSSALLKNLFGKKVFDNPKPIELLQRCLEFCNEDDIVLDFFAGSGTTAHAVLDLNKQDGSNRKFICVQMPEKCEEDSEAFKAGYKTIAEIGKERIRRVIKKIKEEEKQLKLENKEIDLGFKVFKLQPSNFKIWRSDIKEEDLPKQLDAFEKPVKPESQITNMMWEILLKFGYDLNTKVEEKKVNGCDMFSVADAEIVLALSKISEKAIKEITKLKPKKFICLDSLFSGNDQLKTNTALQLKDAGIDFKTI